MICLLKVHLSFFQTYYQKVTIFLPEYVLQTDCSFMDLCFKSIRSYLKYPVINTSIMMLVHNPTSWSKSIKCYQLWLSSSSSFSHNICQCHRNRHTSCRSVDKTVQNSEFLVNQYVKYRDILSDNSHHHFTQTDLHDVGQCSTHCYSSLLWVRVHTF
jgi:hypothetical protein